MSLKKELGILLAVGAVGAAVILGPPGRRPVNPCVVGDATARAQAQVPESLKNTYLDAEKMQFGLGSAAVGGWEGLGDALVAGGRAWVRTTHPRSPKYYEVVSNRYFQSNAFLYIAPERASEARWSVAQATPLVALWEALAKKYPDGVMFAGYVHLAPLRLIAIAHPAIDGRPVRQNAAYYYTRPMESAPETWAYVIGIAAANTATARPDLARPAALLSAGGQRSAGLAHALRLRSAPENFGAPPARENVLAVGQLATNTAVVEGELWLYPVTRAGPCAP